MAIKNIDEARKIAISKRPGMKIEKEYEYDKCYVFNFVPNNYEKSQGIFVGGSTRVDKQTGEVGLFNPLNEGVIK